MRLSSTAGKRRAGRNRQKSPSEQLQLWDRGSGPAAGQPDLQPTRVLLRHPSCGRVLEQVRQVRVFFPELDGAFLKIGLTRSAAGFASREELWIWVNPYRLTRHTIAHEIVHLLQNRNLVPRGEKSADLFALARHAALVDDLPVYLKTPRSFRLGWSLDSTGLRGMLYRTAADALLARAGGERNYLRWFERTLAERWGQVGEARIESSVPLSQRLLF